MNLFLANFKGFVGLKSEVFMPSAHWPFRVVKFVDYLPVQEGGTVFCSVSVLRHQRFKSELLRLWLR